MPRGAVAPVVLSAVAFYAAFTVAGLALHGWNPLWFVWMGERFSELVPHGRTGYDGQFVYYFARDGWAALPHIDNPPYRLQRILYPLLARWAALGHAAAIPWTMVAINAVSIIATTWLVTRWLVAHQVWRWYGLVYPFFVGTVMAYSRDLTEPLSCALAFAGVLLWFEQRQAGALALLALSALARETTVLFALGLAISELAARRWPRVLALAATTLPMIAWQLYLDHRLGAMGIETIQILNLVPAANLLAHMSAEPGRVSALLFITLPLVALTPLVVHWIVTAARDPITWLVILHWLFLLSAPPGAQLHIFAVSRQSTPFVLTLLLAFPRSAPRLRAAVAAVAVVPTVIWLPPVLWWAPWTAKL